MHDWLTKDLGWKAFSVVLAVAVWVTVHKNEDKSSDASGVTSLLVATNTYSDLPMTPLLLLPGERATFDPAVVTVSVSGPRDLMANLRENQVWPQVNLSGVVSGRGLQRPVEVAVPPGVTYSVDPPDVVVTVIPPPETNLLNRIR